jgi:hypothetical protein
MSEEYPIRILAGAGFTASEAGAIHQAVTMLPVEARIDLVERAATSVSGPNGRNVRLLIEGCPPLTVGRKRGAGLCAHFVFDRSAKVRLKLADELGKVRWEGRVPLLKALTEDRDPRVRMAAAGYLLAGPSGAGEGDAADAEGESGRKRDPFEDIGARIESALHGLRPRIKNVFQELDSKIDSALEDIKPKVQEARDRARPRVDGIVSEVQPKVDALLSELQSAIDGLRRDFEVRADRHDDPPVFLSPTLVCPQALPVGYAQAGGAAAESTPADAGPAAAEEPPVEALPAATVTRHTQVAFAPRADDPGAGDLSLALLVEAASAVSHAVDLRVAAGKTHAMVLVNAHSADFQVSPGTRLLRIPRNGDSPPAVFEVRASAARSGVVSLLVYDEVRLAGSIEVRLRAVETADGLALAQEGTVVWRDPAGSVPVAPLGLTVQASLGDEGGGRVTYHALFREKEKGIGVPRLVPLGSSAEDFDAETVQASLASLRSEVDEIEKGLGDPQTLGAGSAEEAMEGLRINFESAGRQLGGDILSPEVRALIENQDAGSVVHWVIRDRALDAVPWELACDPKTGRPLSENVVLVRMPVHGDADAAVPDAPAAAPAAGPARLLYVLGKGVGGAELFPRLKQVVKSAKGYAVETNFDGEQREPVNLVKFKQRVRGARLIHVLCHGVVKSEKGLYLSLEDGALGRVNPLQVLTFQPAPGALVFVNACSSAAATFSPAGLTTFGWNFLVAGAGAYVGTLAPVTTELALRFAEAFFDAHLGEGVPVAEAIFRARQALKGGSDPTWMLYALYADLHTAAPPPT